VRVTAVRAHALRADLPGPFGWSLHATTIRQALLVEVVTDDGLVGWGEAGSGTLPAAGARFVEDVLGPLVAGLDPFELAEVRRRVGTTFDRAGWEFGGFASQAFSGVEVALWDLMGKASGRPVWSLLGGRVRDRVQAYATGLYYYPAAGDGTAEREREATGYVERGYRAMKMKVGGLSPAEDVREVERIRAAVGPDVALMVDANGAYDARTAIALGHELERLGVAWLEEPVARGDLAGYEEVRRALGLPVAGGEHLGGLGAFRAMVSRRAVDILQPDVANCGGLAEATRIATLAQAFHVRVFPHVWGTPPAVAAALHFVATLPPSPVTMHPAPLAQDPVFEFDHSPHPVRDAMAQPELQPVDGWLAVPEGPGLGVEVDSSVLERFAVR
jgi:D-galactarolactone cycloisomerase